MGNVREFLGFVWILAAVATVGCGGPTSPTTGRWEPVESFAAPVQPFVGLSPPNYAGIWRGEYLLVQCRASSPALCKDAPRRETVQLNLSQTNSSLSGSIAFLAQTSAFSGFVTNEFGIAGESRSDITLAVRLSRFNEAFGGFIVKDTYQDGQVIMSKRYELVTPLRIY